MTTPRDADRILRAWLDLMPDAAPDRTVAAVLQAVETTPQTRRPLVRAPWRSTPMTRFALIAAATALGVALLGGALLVGGDRSATPTPTAAPPQSAVPSALPATSLPAPAALLANWLADAPTTQVFGTIDGPLRFIVGIGGQQAWVQTPDGTTSLRSTVAAVGPDELALTLMRAAGTGCAEGAVGRYRWDVADDRTTMTMTPIEDPCPARTEAFARTWTRTHTGFSDGGTAVVPDVGPLFQVTLPAGSYTTRPMTDAHEIYDQERDYILYAWKNPQGFATACSAEERYPWTAGAQSFVDYWRQNDAFTNLQVTPATVGGYPGFEIRFDAVRGYQPCPSQDPLYQLAPKDMPPPADFHLSPGDSDRYWVVDHPDATMLFQVLPIDDSSAEEVIASIRFLDSLPTSP